MARASNRSAMSAHCSALASPCARAWWASATVSQAAVSGRMATPAATTRSIISWVRFISSSATARASSTSASARRPLSRANSTRSASMPTAVAHDRRDGVRVVGRDDRLEGGGRVSAGVGERSLVGCDLGGVDERLGVAALHRRRRRRDQRGRRHRRPAPATERCGPRPWRRPRRRRRRCGLAATIAKASSHRPSMHSASAACPVMSAPSEASIPNRRACSSPATASRATSS